MPTDIEFDFGDPSAPDNPDDALEDDRSGQWLGRIPQWAWIGLAVLVVLTVLIVDVGRSNPNPKSIATPSPSPSLVLPSVTLPVPSLQEELEAAALDSTPLTNVIRSTAEVYSCPAPRQNKLPMDAQLDAIHRAYPAFGQFETGTTLDASAGLCSVNLRARGADGSILIIRVAAPPNQSMPLVVREDVAVVGAYPTFTGVDYVSDLGFRVQVGILGTGRETYSADGVQQLAEDEALTW